MLLEELLFQIAVVIVIAAIFSLVAQRLHQPLIIAYILTGVVVGPQLFAFARDLDVFATMGQLGVAFLLFTVGLGLNWRSVRQVGGVAMATGIGQVLFTSLVGFFIARTLGFDTVASVYLAVAFSFSSTIIIVKLLIDKEDLDTLYGRISVGFLLVQDFIALLILLGLAAFRTESDLNIVLWQTLGKGLILVPIFWFISARVVPWLVTYAARAQELLFIFAIAWCFLIAGLLTWLGFGLEFGALIAGVTLSGTLFEREMQTRIRPLRDFFLIIFFVVLGTQLLFDNMAAFWWPAVAFSAFILMGNPLIVMLIMRVLGYHPRTGFLAGTTVAQISEFSFIVLGAGVALGHLPAEHLSFATIVGLATIALSSYMIAYNERIYNRVAFLFRWLEPEPGSTLERVWRKPRAQVALLGYHRIGQSALPSIRAMQLPYLVVDFNPRIVQELTAHGEPVVYGDVGDINFLSESGIEKARLIISAIPDIGISLTLLDYLRQKKCRGAIIVSVRTAEEARQCYAAGASYVIVPNMLGGEKFREFLEKKKLRVDGWNALGRAHQRTS